MKALARHRDIPYYGSVGELIFRFKKKRHWLSLAVWLTGFLAEKFQFLKKKRYIPTLHIVTLHILTTSPPLSRAPRRRQRKVSAFLFLLTIFPLLLLPKEKHRKCLRRLSPRTKKKTQRTMLSCSCSKTQCRQQ